MEDVLGRSRFDFEHESIEGVDVYVAGEINATDVLNSIPSNRGWVRLMFKHGPIVGIDLQALKATKEKQSAFVHHLALSMLPPLLSSIVDIDAMWVPDGWNPEEDLPPGAHDGLDKLVSGWHGLTVPEGNLTHACQRAVLDSLDFGLLIGSSWSNGDFLTEFYPRWRVCKDRRMKSCLLPVFSSRLWVNRMEEFESMQEVVGKNEMVALLK